MTQTKTNLKITHGDEGWHPRHIDLIACLYISMLFLTWITAGKLFVLGGLIFSASLLIYPLNAVFGDILTEVYGFNRTRRLIWMGLICGIIFILFTQIAIALPPAESYQMQDAFAAINGAIPRIVIASYLAYLCCEFTNSFIMSKMKIWQNADNFPLRAFASTFAAQLVDSAVFFVIAFAGVIPTRDLLIAIIGSWILKTVYETLALPMTTVAVRKLKRLEGVEQFDRYELKVFRF